MCAKEESFQVERAIDYILFKGIKFVEMSLFFTLQ